MILVSHSKKMLGTQSVFALPKENEELLLYSYISLYEHYKKYKLYIFILWNNLNRDDYKMQDIKKNFKPFGTVYWKVFLFLILRKVLNGKWLKE